MWFYLSPDAALVTFLTIFVQLPWPGSKHVTISHGIDTFYVAQTKRHLQFGPYEMDLWLFEAAGHKPNQSVSRGQIPSRQTDIHCCVGNVQQMLPCDQDISALNKLLINLCQMFGTAVCINLVC